MVIWILLVWTLVSRSIWWLIGLRKKAWYKPPFSLVFLFQFIHDPKLCWCCEFQLIRMVKPNWITTSFKNWVALVDVRLNSFVLHTHKMLVIIRIYIPTYKYKEKNWFFSTINISFLVFFLSSKLLTVEVWSCMKLIIMNSFQIWITLLKVNISCFGDWENFSRFSGGKFSKKKKEKIWKLWKDLRTVYTTPKITQT